MTMKKVARKLIHIFIWINDAQIPNGWPVKASFCLTSVRARFESQCGNISNTFCSRKNMLQIFHDNSAYFIFYVNHLFAPEYAT